MSSATKPPSNISVHFELESVKCIIKVIIRGIRTDWGPNKCAKLSFWGGLSANKRSARKTCAAKSVCVCHRRPSVLLSGHVATAPSTALPPCQTIRTRSLSYDRQTHQKFCASATEFAGISRSTRGRSVCFQAHAKSSAVSMDRQIWCSPHSHLDVTISP